jgi:hypothetical protein
MPLSQPERSRSTWPAWLDLQPGQVGSQAVVRAHAAEAEVRVGAAQDVELIGMAGKAGDHQVPDARTALGHAYGGGSQYFSMWVVASTPADPASGLLHEITRPAGRVADPGGRQVHS